MLNQTAEKTNFEFVVKIGGSKCPASLKTMRSYGRERHLTKLASIQIWPQWRCCTADAWCFRLSRTNVKN